MKILYYSPHPHLNLSDPSGYGTHMREIINAFQENGHTVETLIIGGEERSQSSSEVKPSKVKMFLKSVIPTILWETLKDYQLLKIDKQAEKKLFKKVKEFKPEIIYERFNYLQKSGSNIAKENNLKHYIEVNSPYSFERKTYQGNSFFINKSTDVEGSVLRNASKVIVVSTALKEYFTKEHKIPQDKFIVTPNAINPKAISISNSNLKKEFNLDDQIPIIGFVGSISEWHGVYLLIDLQEKLKLDGIKTKTLIVGGGESLDKLKLLSKVKSLQNEIIFTDSVDYDKVYNYINCFDIAIMPKSNWYGSPIKIFEYAAINKPVIAPNNIPVNDVAQHKVHAWLSEENIEGLYEGVKFMLDNPERRFDMAEKFNQKVMEEHTWNHMAKIILD